MPEACLDSWQPYACEWSVGYLWRTMGWSRRLDLIVLALMLAYVVVVFVRDSYRYQIARRTLDTDTPGNNRNELRADLSIHLGILAAIASAAPYLGAVGTCIGIMKGSGLMAGINMEHNAFVAMMALHIASALFTTAAGILVAVPAICVYNYLRVRANLLKGGGAHRPFQGTGWNLLGGERFVLRERFSHLPPFPLIAAPCLAALVALYTPFFSPRGPMGLGVELAPARCEFDGDDRLIVLWVTNTGEVFINHEQEDWSALSGRLSETYSMRKYRTIYLVAENDVPFQTAADAIDIANSLSLNVLLVTPVATKARCLEPVAIHSPRHVRR